MAQAGAKAVLANSVLYTFGNLLLKVFSFFLIPLYTSYLLPDQYGILNLANSFTAVVSLIMSLGLQFAVIRFYIDFRGNREKLARMFGTIIGAIILFGFLISVGLYMTKDYWCAWLFKDIDFFPIIFLSILISLVTALYTVYQDSLKGMQQVRKSVLMTYIFFFFLLGANLLTVVGLRMGATGILTSTLFVNVVMVGVMMVDLIKQKLFTCCIDKFILKDLLRYSLPIVPHTMSYTISSFVTRIIINTKMSVSALGIFSLASQFGGVSDVALNSVQSAFQPWIFGRLHDCNDANVKQVTDDIRSVSYLLMWLYGLMYILIASFSQETVILMAADSYHSAWIYVPAMVFVVAIKSPLYFYNNFLYYQKDKTVFVFITTFVSSLVSISFTWLLVPHYGIFGSVAADVIALVVRTMIVIPVVYKQACAIYSFVKLTIFSFVPIVFIAIAVMPSYLGMIDNFWLNILYKLGILSLYVLCIVLVYRQRLLPYLTQLFCCK